MKLISADTVISIRQLEYYPNQNSSLYARLRGYLILGRILGIVPLQGLFGSNSSVQSVKLSYWSWPFFTSMTITLLLVFCAVVSSIIWIKIPKSSATDLAWRGSSALFYLYASFVHIYFLRCTKQLSLLLQKWESVKLRFTKEDRTLRRHFTMLIGIIFTSAVLENIVYTLTKFPIVDDADVLSVKPKDGKNKSQRIKHGPLEEYYERDFIDWKDLIPYNPVLAVTLFFANKFAIYAWNYADILIALISRAFYFQFKAIQEVAEEEYTLKSERMTDQSHFWKSLVQDHNSVCQLLEQFGEFLSPIIFLSFSINIYFLCLLINLAITPSSENGTIATIYSIWSFIQMTGRVFVFSLAAARVNDYANGVHKLYEKCPSEYYSTDIKRSEIRLTLGRHTALHGLKCFYITKEFLLKILGVIFTFEIVLLQSGASGTEAK